MESYFICLIYLVVTIEANTNTSRILNIAKCEGEFKFQEDQDVICNLKEQSVEPKGPQGIDCKCNNNNDKVCKIYKSKIRTNQQIQFFGKPTDQNKKLRVIY